MMWNSLPALQFSAFFQVAVLALGIYYIFLFVRGTRGAQVLIGLVLLLVVLIGVTQAFHLEALNWIFRQFSVYLAVALLVIFQPEIRRALAELGRQPVFTPSVERGGVIDQVVTAVDTLAEHRVGALIAIEREIGTRAIQETGVRLDARVVPELLATIFFPHTPLHDGGVVIQGSRIMAAACTFPLSRNIDQFKSSGMRHRAAAGMSEETDAVIVVVSEETGTISVCYRGRMSRGLDKEKLRRFLAALLKENKTGSAWRRAQEQLDLTPGGIAKSEKRDDNSGGGA